MDFCVPETPLIGRETVVADLQQAVDALVAGTGGRIVLEGAAGVGKTRLTREILSYAERRDVRAYSGRATELDSVAPMTTLRSFPCGRELAHPKLAGMDGLQIVDRIGSKLEDMARKRPLIIALDDVQWADEVTMLAVRVLVSELRTFPVLWLCARRSGRAPGYATEAIDWLIGEGARRITVEPLSESEVARLCAALLEAEPDRAMLRFADRSGGNPFLIEYLVRTLRDNGQVSVTDGSAVLTGDELQPEFLRGGDRLLYNLTDSTRWMLQVASVLARPFAVREIAHLAGRSPVDVLPALDEAVESGALVDHGDQFAFRHDLIRSALYRALAGPVRTTLHREASALAQIEGRPAGETAEHLLHGRTDDEQSLTVLLRTADQMRLTAPRTAASLILHVLDSIGAEDARRPELTADAVRLLAKVGRASEARELGENAVQVDLSPTQEGVLLLALAEAFYVTGDHIAVVEYTSKALAIPQVPENIRSQLQAIRAHGLMDEQGTPDFASEADASASDAVEGARETDSPATLTCGHGGRSRAAVDQGRLAAAVASGTEAVRVADEAGGEARHRHPRIWLASALTAANRFNEAEEVLAADEGEAAQLGTAWSRPLWHQNRSDLLLAVGRLDEAEAEAEAGLQIAEQFRAHGQDLQLLAARARISFHRDELAGCREYVDQANRMAVERGIRPPTALVWMSVLLTEADGPPEAVLSALDGFLRSEAHCTSLLVQEPHAAAHIVGIAKRAGAKNEADLVVRTLRTLSERNPEVPVFDAAARYAEGVLDDDLTALRTAVRSYRASPRVLARAAVKEETAQLAAAMGRREEAIDLAESALEEFAAHGANRDAGRLQETLGRLGVRKRLPEKAAGWSIGWDSLTKAELRVVRLVAEGLTNREVANELFLSPHTVDSHLRHSFTKLGVNSRVELTRYVLAHDVLPQPGQ